MNARTLAAGFTPLQPLPGDARHEATLVQTPEGEAVLHTVLTTCDVEHFLSTTRRLMTVAHPALRVPTTCGVHSDGRPWVLAPVKVGAPLPASLPTSSVLLLGIEWAGALGALHEAQLVAGGVDASTLWYGPPAVIDLALAGLATPNANARDDVRALAEALGALAGPHQPDALRAALKGAGTALSLQLALKEVQARSSANTLASVAEVEVVESDLSGNQLGPWQLERVLGEGAMGRVYLARHQRIGRRAAVKVLKREHASNAELVHRFIQEAQAVNAIKNEHIVEVYDFGDLATRDGSKLVYCVMELLDGEALSDTLNRGPMAVRRVAHVGAQLGLALAAAHRVGVVHRDIKPENIMLTRRGTDPDFVKVLDFGVAKLLKPIGDLPQTGTLAGIVVGTPEYMAPEQALGSSVDLRSDLYSVGLVLYELITGTQPFQADTFGKLVVEMTQKAAPRLPAVTRLGEAVPRGLAAIIHKLLAKEPDARFQSGELLAEAIAPFASDDPPADVAPPPAPPTELSAEDLEPLKSPARRWVLWGATALGVVLGTMGVIALFSGHEPPTEPTPVPVVAAAMNEAPAKESVGLEVTSKPAGAKVTRADTGEALGVTPFKVQVAQAGATSLTFTLEGFEVEQRDVDLSTSVSVSVDLRGQHATKPPAVPDQKVRPDAKVEHRKPGRPKANKDGTVDPFAP